ncbi:MAG: asparagine synthase (glutamine-hydrolyzing) [Pseudomonadales bacterium]|nr:asparagine synthase (glutamine-hydrolyzing) [Pseudomonadales bacterium]
MCGIAAIFGYHDASPRVAEAELASMSRKMIQRGPDGDGSWFSENERVGMAHRRLSIIDPGASSNQPMVCENGKSVISFNGEIYNYRELKRLLEGRGYRFRTDSDTEVLLGLYCEFGEHMFRKLQGMFAICIWDGEKNSMLVARDPYGIKPLYYADDGWTFRAASQVKAIIAASDSHHELEPASLVGFMLLGSVPEPYTIRRNVFALPPGTFCWVSKEGVGDPRSYFSILEALAYDGDRPAITEPELLEKIGESVSRHLVSDVPLSLFLSAGLDSTCLSTFIAQDHADLGVHAMCLGFDEHVNSPQDERPLARQLAEYLGLSYSEMSVNETEFGDEIEPFFQAMDQPTIDGMNVWLISKHAREQGFKVALSGIGGDELFGGYPSFHRVPRAKKVLGWSRFAGNLFSLLTPPLLRVASTFNAHPKSAGVFEYGGTMEKAYFLQRALFLPQELSSILDPGLVRDGLERLRLTALLEGNLVEGGDELEQVSQLESSLYLRNQLLRDADWAGMAHSLEIRTPFVDSTLLTDLMQFKGVVREDKACLYNVMKSRLPKNAVDRAKTGFVVPIKDWQANRFPEVTTDSSDQLWGRRWSKVVLREYLGKESQDLFC